MTIYRTLIDSSKETLIDVYQNYRENPTLALQHGALLILTVVAYNCLAGPIATWGSRCVAGAVLSPLLTAIPYRTLCVLSPKQHGSAPLSTHAFHALHAAACLLSINAARFLTPSRMIPVLGAWSFFFIYRANQKLNGEIWKEVTTSYASCVPERWQIALRGVLKKLHLKESLS